MVSVDRLFRSTLIRICVLLTGLFLCTIPVFYIVVSNELNGMDIPYLYVSLRLLRFMSLLLIGAAIRKKSKAIPLSIDKKSKLTLVLLCCILLSTYMHLTNASQKLYMTISSTLGIFHQETVPLFFAVLWEQIFSGDLYWSVLLCLTIVFFTWPEPNKRNK